MYGDGMVLYRPKGVQFDAWHILSAMLSSADEAPSRLLLIVRWLAI